MYGKMEICKIAFEIQINFTCEKYSQHNKTKSFILLRYCSEFYTYFFNTKINKNKV